MTTTPTSPNTDLSFFIVGGTLPPDAPSYIERKADGELLTHLAVGEFCYVLTSRQMGKSSLMVRVASRLRREGAKVALVDLTQIGQNVTPEQWYNGLLVRLGMAFDLEDELEDFWNSDDSGQRLGPLQRWMSAIREVIVARIPGNIVIFIDEIDGVRNLPFSSDEFFAGLRNFYNDTGDPVLERLTFCLVGVASPTELISNTSTTPFNIGFRVVLSDFTEKEAEPFVEGLGRTPELGAKLVRRILWWTGGHPYLTQRMCAAVAADASVTSNAGVDRICSELFFSARSRESDNNLQFVCRLITDRADEAELAALLDFYERIRIGKKMPVDDTNRNIDILRLAGLIAVRGNRLAVRNRIYSKAFDRNWIRTYMPDAEARRQRAAFARGVVLATALAVAVIAVVVGLMLKGLDYEQQVAIGTYCSNVAQVEQDFDSGDYATGYNLLRETEPLVRLQPRATERFLGNVPLLNRTLPFVRRHPFLYAILNGFDKKAAGGFEWNYLLARSFGDSALAYSGHTNDVRSVAISPDGKWLATGGADSTVRIYPIGQINNPAGQPYKSACIPQCPVRALLVLDSIGDARPVERTSASDWSVNAQLVSALGKRPVSSLPGVMSVQFLPDPYADPDGGWLAVATGNSNQPNIPGTVYLWNTKPSGEVVQPTTGSERKFLRAVDSVEFKEKPDSPGAWELAATSEDNTAKFWSISRAGSSTFKGSFDSAGKASQGVSAAAYSPDGSMYAMIFGDGHLWLQQSQQPWKTGCSEPFIADVSGLMSIVFYDNDNILLGTRDGRVVRLDLTGQRGCVKTLKPSTFLETGEGLVTSLTVSGDGNFLVTTGSSGVVLVWKLVRDERPPHALLAHGENVVLRAHRDVVYSAAMTPDERLLVSAGASALTGGSPNSKSGVLTANPGSRICFWELQPGPDGELPLAAKPVPIFSVAQLARITWASQPKQFQVDGAVPALAFSPQGSELVSIRGDFKGNESTDQPKPTEIYFTPLDSTTWKPEGSKPNPQHSPLQTGAGTALAWSGDAKYVATASKDGTMLLWDAVKQTPTRLEMPQGSSSAHAPIPIMALSFLSNGWLAGTPSGATAAATLNFTWQQKQYSNLNSIFLWKPEESPAIQKVIALPPVPPKSGTALKSGESFWPEKLAFSAVGDQVAACGIDSLDGNVRVQIWDSSSLLEASLGTPVKALAGSEYPANHDHPGILHSQCTAVAFSPDGRWLAVGTSAHEIAVWSTANWSRVEGGLVLSGSLYGATGISRGSYLDEPPMVTAAINAIAFSPDSMRLAYGTADAKIYLWSVTARLPLNTIAVHTGGVLALAFSPDLDGRCLASGGNDQTVIFSCAADQALLDLRKAVAVSTASYDKVTPETYNWIPFAQ